MVLQERIEFSQILHNASFVNMLRETLVQWVGTGIGTKGAGESGVFTCQRAAQSRRNIGSNGNMCPGIHPPLPM